jgi:UDP-N-acetylglucosamine--N-acetylmuramyl-(pentapeptide) pyrophosphoryl-undecaprenol N-acetylglucosamine transferase
MMRESGLTGEILAGTISECLQNREELHTMAANMKTLAMPDATKPDRGCMCAACRPFKAP